MPVGLKTEVAAVRPLASPSIVLAPDSLLTGRSPLQVETDSIGPTLEVTAGTATTAPSTSLGTPEAACGLRLSTSPEVLGPRHAFAVALHGRPAGTGRSQVATLAFMEVPTTRRGSATAGTTAGEAAFATRQAGRKGSLGPISRKVADVLSRHATTALPSLA